MRYAYVACLVSTLEPGQGWEVETDVCLLQDTRTSCAAHPASCAAETGCCVPARSCLYTHHHLLPRLRKHILSYNVKTRSYMLIQVYLLTSPCHFPFYLRMIIVLLSSSFHIYYISMWRVSNEELRKFNCQICHPRLCARKNSKFTEQLFMKFGIDGFY